MSNEYYKNYIEISIIIRIAIILIGSIGLTNYLTLSSIKPWKSMPKIAVYAGR